LSDALTLEADRARIDLAGQPLLSGLELRSDAPRLALLGDWSPLFRLLSAEAELSSGSLRVCGMNVPLGVALGAVGLMRLDPPLPATWSAEQFLASSAELAGTAKISAKNLVLQTLERLGLTELATRRLAELGLAERRALLVAHATLTDPRVLCLEEPLVSLDTLGERAVLAVIERASAGRRLLVAVADPELSAASRELVASCAARLRLAAGVVVTETDDAPLPSRFTASVCRNHEAFAQALAARGLIAHATHEAGVLNSLTSAFAGPCWRYLIELPQNSTAPILDAALETQAGLVELTPLTP
jgi:ABC-type Na+ transport system ATPase subunit NatA